MATAKKYPEFELPAKLLETIKGYLGTAKMAQLSALQRGQIADAVNSASVTVGHIIEPPTGQTNKSTGAGGG